MRKNGSVIYQLPQYDGEVGGISTKINRSRHYNPPPQLRTQEWYRINRVAAVYRNSSFGASPEAIRNPNGATEEPGFPQVCTELPLGFKGGPEFLWMWQTHSTFISYRLIRRCSRSFHIGASLARRELGARRRRAISSRVRPVG